MFVAGLEPVLVHLAVQGLFLRIWVTLDWFSLFVSLHIATSFLESFFVQHLFILVDSDGVSIVAERLEVNVLSSLLLTDGELTLTTVPLKAALGLEGPKCITVITLCGELVFTCAGLWNEP